MTLASHYGVKTSRIVKGKRDNDRDLQNLPPEKHRKYMLLGNIGDMWIGEK